jgi:hypothetical protein
MRTVLIAIALGALAVAVAQAGRTDASRSTYPSWIPSKLGAIAIRPAAPERVAIERAAAVDVVLTSVFLGDGPREQPLAYPLLASGRIARYPIPPSPTGEVDVPTVRDVPAWLVVWRGLDAGTLDERFGVWPDGALVDAVFVVDGETGDCCWFTRFLSGSARFR